MLARLIDVHRAAGFARTGLDVNVDNVTSALRVYERLGFTVVKRSAPWVLPVPEAGGPASSPDPGSPPASRR
ncbi:MAG: GNAT family N-acetyltransferase [Mycobacteriales bacterium]